MSPSAITNATEPDLRFPAFNDAWEIGTLSEKAEKIASGKTKPEKTGEFPVYGSIEEIGRCSAFTHDEGTLLIARVGANAGTINRASGKYSVTDNTLIFSPKNGENLTFIEYFLKSFNLKRLVFGTGQPLITGGLLKSIRTIFPSLPEQRKVADFLTAVDDRIGQLIQKKSLLEEYKKGVRQQLFTQAIRFKDDQGNDFPDWEEKKLGDVTTWASGGTPSKQNPSFWAGDIPWMSAASMHERYYSHSPLMITQSGVESGSKMAKKGTLLLLVRGSMLWNRIPVGITTRDVAFNQDVKALVPESSVLAEFLLQWFIASENMLLHKVVGTGIGAGKLATDEMKKLPILLPVPEEQAKIADFLSAIDCKIEAVANQITETQSYKRGLLQQMFV